MSMLCSQGEAASLPEFLKALVQFCANAFILLYIQLGWYVYVLAHIFTVLFALTNAFGQQVFNLSVYRAEIIFRPGGYCVVQLRRKSERYLFFVVLIFHFFPYQYRLPLFTIG